MAETKMRFIRIADQTWDAAQRRAETDGTTVSAEVRKFLEGYGGTAPSEAAVATELRRLARRISNAEAFARERKEADEFDMYGPK